MASRRLSPHFTEDEFDCHNGAEAPDGYLYWAAKLCHDYLEPLRAVYGPVTILSGFRTAQYNGQVGGAPASFHTRRAGRRGAAADITCAKGTPREWYQALDGAGIPGLGIYPGHVHADNRAGRARW